MLLIRNYRRLHFNLRRRQFPFAMSQLEGSETEWSIQNDEGNDDKFSTNRCPFLELPKELRFLLYKKYLSKKDQKVMRLINHQIRFEVEQNVDFHIKIDYRSFRACRRLMNLRADTFTVRSLPTRKPKPLMPKHAARIKTVIFDGAVSPSSVNNIITKCFKVKELSFTNEILHYSTDFGQCRKLHQTLESFSFLTTLSIQFTRHPKGDPYAPTEPNVFFFLKSTFRHLLTFKLLYSLWGNWLDLFLFLTRHVGSLRHLELQVGDRCDSKNNLLYLSRNSHDSILQIIERDVLRKLQLKEFRFRDEVLNLNPTIAMLIFDILAYQKSLEKLHFYSPGDMNQKMLRSVVDANQKTLQEVVIYNFTGERIQPPPVFGPKLNIDFTQFSTSNLKVLALSCHLSSTSLNQRQGHRFIPVHVLHMNSLPSSLERIHLTAFNFCVLDLIEASFKLPNLKELLIADSRTDLWFSKTVGSFVINCPNLEFLSICPVRPTRQARPFDKKDPDVIELLEIYSRFMKVNFDPNDDLCGFEARNFTDLDRQWMKATVDLREFLPKTG